MSALQIEDVSLQAWRVIAASVQGTSHLEKAVPCQDVHAYRLLPAGELLAAAADGAGSAERSQEGAQLAVEQALLELESLLSRGAPASEAGWQDAWNELFGAVHQKLAAFASAANAPLNAFATTLTCAVVTADWLAVGQIGDGAAVIETATGDLLLTVRPQRGEYANEACFVTMREPLQYLSVYASSQPVQGLILTTDGLLRLAFKLPDYTPSARFFQPLLVFARQAAAGAAAEQELNAFLASEKVCARTDDDKTLLVAVRQASGGKE